MSEQTITKILSANDTGETGGHQAGLLIPREQRILSFFPALDHDRLNPRAHLRFEDEGGHFWEFAYIYYNNRFFGGTRNEYRLTRMTKYIRGAGLVTGDEVIMHRHPTGEYSISYRRANEPASTRTEEGRTVLKLGSGWKVIDIEGESHVRHRKHRFHSRSRADYGGPARHRLQFRDCCCRSSR